MDIIIIFSLVILVCAEVLYATRNNRHYNNGYLNGWKDCYHAHKQFEMSPDDMVILYIMKKAFKSYIRNKKYIDKNDLDAIDTIEDFKEFKHLVHDLAVYRKENIERE